MPTKPFDLEAFKKGAAVQTRDGKKIPWLEVCQALVEAGASYPILYAVEGERGFHSATLDGVERYNDVSSFDIVMAPRTKTFYVHVAREGDLIWSNTLHTKKDSEYHLELCAERGVEVLAAHEYVIEI